MFLLCFLLRGFSLFPNSGHICRPPLLLPSPPPRLAVVSEIRSCVKPEKGPCHSSPRLPLLQKQDSGQPCGRLLWLLSLFLFSFSKRPSTVSKQPGNWVDCTQVPKLVTSLLHFYLTWLPSVAQLSEQKAVSRTLLCPQVTVCAVRPQIMVWCVENGDPELTNTIQLQGAPRPSCLFWVNKKL